MCAEPKALPESTNTKAMTGHYTPPSPAGRPTGRPEAPRGGEQGHASVSPQVHAAILAELADVRATVERLNKMDKMRKEKEALQAQPASAPGHRRVHGCTRRRRWPTSQRAPPR